jgi:hypothetical protein
MLKIQSIKTGCPESWSSLSLLYIQIREREGGEKRKIYATLIIYIPRFGEESECVNRILKWMR